MLRRQPRSQGSPPQQGLKGMKPRQETRGRPAAIGGGGSRSLGARGARASPAGAKERPTRHEMRAHEK
eukprot:322486-Alexandrium_andersonii.AAC.1